MSAPAGDRAVLNFRKAGVAANHRAANRESVTCLEAALEAVANMDEGAERTQHAIDARSELELPLMGLGQFHRSLEHLREAESLARAAGDSRRLARIYSRMTYHLGSLGEFTAALETGERALALATEHADVARVISTNVVVARALYGLGDYARTIDLARHNDSLVGRTEDSLGPSNVAFSRVWAVLAMAEVGGFAEGSGVGEEAVRVTRAQGWRHEEVWACLGLGRLYVVQGAWERAIATLEPALPLCETSSDLAVYFSRTASSLGEAYTRSGRMAEGLVLLARAASHTEAIGFIYSHALVLGMLGAGHLLAGEILEGGRCAEAALDTARRYRQRGWEAWALRLLGEVAVRRDPLDLAAAERHFCEARALAEERGMQPLVTHCRLELGEAYRRAGDHARAEAEIAAALAEYRALQMPYWAARVANSGF